MIVGIITQLVSVCVFAVFLAIVVKCGVKTIRNLRSMQLCCGATAFAVMRMIIRGVYRSIELVQGWTGYLITTERYFVALDGCTAILSLVVYKIWNPGRLFNQAKAGIDAGAKIVDVEQSGAE